MMTEEYKVTELIWLNIEPDSEEYTRSNAYDAVDWLRDSKKIDIDSREEYIDYGFGQNELFDIKGTQAALRDLELFFYDRCRYEAEYEAEVQK